MSRFPTCLKKKLIREVVPCMLRIILFTKSFHKNSLIMYDLPRDQTKCGDPMTPFLMRLFHRLLSGMVFFCFFFLGGGVVVVVVVLCVGCLFRGEGERQNCMVNWGVHGFYVL